MTLLHQPPGGRCTRRCHRPAPAFTPALRSNLLLITALPGMRCRQPGQPLQQSAAHGAMLRGGSLPRSGRRRGWRCRGGVDDKVLYTEELPLSKLQQQLDQAIDDEDYEAAAQLRDVIQ